MFKSGQGFLSCINPTCRKLWSPHTLSIAVESVVLPGQRQLWCTGSWCVCSSLIWHFPRVSSPGCGQREETRGRNVRWKIVWLWGWLPWFKSDNYQTPSGFGEVMGLLTETPNESLCLCSASNRGTTWMTWHLLLFISQSLWNPGFMMLLMVFLNNQSQHYIIRSFNKSLSWRRQVFLWVADREPSLTWCSSDMKAFSSDTIK